MLLEEDLDLDLMGGQLLQGSMKMQKQDGEFCADAGGRPLTRLPSAHTDIIPGNEQRQES